MGIPEEIMSSLRKRAEVEIRKQNAIADRDPDKDKDEVVKIIVGIFEDSSDLVPVVLSSIVLQEILTDISAGVIMGELEERMKMNSSAKFN